MYSTTMKVNRLNIATVYLLLFTVIILLNSCASISPPTGGKKDIRPPRVLYTIPAQQSTDFKGQKTVIAFDEKINTAKLKEKIIITPYYPGEFEINTSGKKLILKFNDTLRQNETYTINFSNGLIDLNESNPIKLYKHVFSTGTKIDSMHLYGRVVNNYTKEPIPNAVVGLYRLTDTINPEIKKPYYFGITNEIGIYTITNIKKGSYEAFAFSDNNKDLVFDIRKDKIGFLTKTLVLDTMRKDSLLFEIDRNDVEAPDLRNIKNESEIKLNFSEGIYKYSVESEQKLYYVLTEKEKQILFYKTDYCEDSIPVKITVTDSSYNDTTISVKLVQSQPKTFKKTSDIIKGFLPDDKFEYIDSLPIKIEIKEPVIEERDSSIVISPDSNMKYGVQYLNLNKHFNKNESNTYYTYTYIPGRKPKKFIMLVIKGGTLASSLSDTNKTYIRKYLISKPNKQESEESHATVRVTTTKENYIVELLNDKYEILKTEHNKKNIQFRDLKPGNYHVRVIIDKNKDKKWDSGNYRIKQKAEITIVYKNILPVIKNWDIEDVEITF